MGPTDGVFGDEQQQERLERLVRAGWLLRYDGGRDEFVLAVREVRGRTLDAVMDAAEAADGGPS